MWANLETALQLDQVEIAPGATNISLVRMLKNTTDQEVHMILSWNFTNTGWRMEPASSSITMKPGAELEYRCEGGGVLAKLLPLPGLEVTLQVGAFPPRVYMGGLTARVRRQAAVAFLPQSPRVDGVIEASEYDGAESQGLFYEMHGRGTASVQTVFRTAYDRETLYIAVSVQEPLPGSIIANATNHDGQVYMDDSVELFVDPAAMSSDYFQFIVNMKGVMFEAFGSSRTARFGDPSWNGEWRAAVKPAPGGYAVEVAIPFKTMGVAAPVQGATWGLNVARTRTVQAKDMASRELSAWSPTYTGFHRPTHFGRILFR